MNPKVVGLRFFLGPIISLAVRVLDSVVAIPDARFGANIRDPKQWTGSCQFPYKRMDIRVYTA